MAQYWIFEIANPQTGKSSRAIAYAADPTTAESRVRQWLASNPFQLGATDFKDFLGTWDSQKHNPTLSMERPSAQAGDISFDLPSEDTPPPDEEPPPTGDTGTGGFIGPPTGIPENEPSAQFLRGLANRGVDTKTIAGRAQAGQANDFFRSFLFQNLLQGFTVPGQTFLTAPTTEQGTAGKWASDPEEKAKQLAGLGFQEGDPNAFQQFTQSHDVGGARRGAADALRGLLTGNMSGVDLKALQTLRGPEQFGQPSEGQANQLAQLAQVALQSRISPLALSLLRLPSGEDVRNQYLAQGQGNSFLDYFREQYPLMGLGI